MDQSRVDRFLRDGYLFPIRVLAPEAARRYRERLDAFEAGDRFRRCPDPHTEIYLFKPHLLLEWVDALVHETTLLDAAESLLGPDLLCWSAGVFQKQPRSPHFVSWHQDAVYYGLSPVDHAVRIWVALTPTSLANGAMTFARGAHRLGLRPHRPGAQADNLLSRGEVVDIAVADYENVVVELAPGEASAHHLHTPHASGPNASDERRVNLVVTYISPDVRPRSGEDSALLVRGADRFGNFRPEARLDAEFSAAAVAAHARAMALRRRVFAAEERRSAAQ